MNILFLDDNDRRCHTFRSNFPSADIVNTAEEAIMALENNTYDLICLDPAKAIMIHTHNPPAGNRMVSALMRHYEGVYRHAFGPIMLLVTGQIIDELEQ
jgi:hypothetical protein